MALSHSQATDPQSVKKARSQQLRFIVFIVAILIALILLPTPRVFTKSTLVVSQPFLDIIELGQTITHDATGLRNNSRITIRISSTEYVTAVIVSSQNVVYNASGKDHDLTFNLSSTSLSISLKNSSPAFVGRSAIVATSVEDYVDYVVEQWLPWWIKS